MEEHKVEYYDNGNKDYEEWFIHGYSHREDGPSCIGYNPDGSKNYETWDLCDHEYTEFKHRELVELSKSITTRDHAIMNIKHPSEYIKRKCQEILNGRV
jgi:hypothetical protein